MPGARRTRSRACSVENTRVSHHGCAGKHPAFPHAMVLTVSFVLSPVIGLFCHRHQRRCRHSLERQRRGVRTTRLRRPQPTLFVKSAAASTAPHPASVTIAIRPSCGTGCAYFAFDLGSRSTTPIAADWHDGQIIRTVQFPSASVRSAEALSPAAERP